MRDCNSCSHQIQGVTPKDVKFVVKFHGDHELKTDCEVCLAAADGALPFYEPNQQEAARMAEDYIQAHIPGPTQSAGQFDPKGLDAKAPGAKLDGGKPQVVSGVVGYFPRAVEAVAKLSGHGAEKYSWGGWASVEDGVRRYSDGLGRHITQEAIEGPYDLEWLNKYGHHVLHATAVAWNALARLELMLREGLPPAPTREVNASTDGSLGICAKAYIAAPPTTPVR